MKLNKKFRNALLVGSALIITTATGIIGGITYSKYYTKIDGEGTAEVARWSFKANNATQTMENITLSKVYDEAKLKAGKIAPGTSGSFDIVIDATGSEVGIDYVIDFQNETNKPQNLKFTAEGVTSNTLNGLENAIRGSIDQNGAKTKTITVNWNWEYETGMTSSAITTNDAQDTADSQNDFSFDVVITGTQVNPDNRHSG